MSDQNRTFKTAFEEHVQHMQERVLGSKLYPLEKPMIAFVLAEEDVEVEAEPVPEYYQGTNEDGLPWVVVNENHPNWIEAQVQVQNDRLVNVANTPCAHWCGWVEPYGFVPEADCPMHDAPSFKPTKEEWDEIIKLHREHKPQPCGCGGQRGFSRVGG